MDFVILIIIDLIRSTLPFFIIFLLFIIYLFYIKKFKTILLLLLCLLIVISFIIFPNFISCYGNRFKISSVKANMHIFHKIIENYSKKNNGCYPKNLIDLKKHSKKEKYWKDLRNPYTGKYDSSIIDFNLELIDNIELKNNMNIIAGSVLYKVVKNKGSYIKDYYLYGTYKEDKLLDDFK